VHLRLPLLLHRDHLPWSLDLGSGLDLPLYPHMSTQQRK
jgi:hypothetical protein